MAVVQIRDVPDEVLAVCKVRAAAAGQSLQAYLRTLLEKEATAPTPHEVAARAREIAARGHVTDEVLESAGRSQP